MGILWQQQEAEEIQWEASAEDWKQFLQTRCWRDLKQYLQISLEDGKELLSLDFEERAIAETDETLRGGIKMLRRIIAFPEEQMRELENDRGRNDTDGIDTGI